MNEDGNCSTARSANAYAAPVVVSGKLGRCDCASRNNSKQVAECWPILEVLVLRIMRRRSHESNGHHVASGLRSG